MTMISDTGMVRSESSFLIGWWVI